MEGTQNILLATTGIILFLSENNSQPAIWYQEHPDNLHPLEHLQKKEHDEN